MPRTWLREKPLQRPYRLFPCYAVDGDAEEGDARHGKQRSRLLHCALVPAERPQEIPKPLDPKTDIRVYIRWMIRRDMVEVLDLEQRSFEYAWTEEDFLRCLRQRNCIGMVAEQKEKILGFMVYELHKRALHVLNLAVHPENRRRGVGTQMVERLKSKLSTHRRSRVSMELRETNLPAQLFLRSRCFRAEKVLPHFYEDSGEDAFRFAYMLPGAQPDLE